MKLFNLGRMGPHIAGRRHPKAFPGIRAASLPSGTGAHFIERGRSAQLELVQWARRGTPREFGPEAPAEYV
jgi:hypothetical protein